MIARRSIVANRRAAVFVIAVCLGASWIGCNAILGNESATFDPNVEGGASSSSGTTTTSSSGTTTSSSSGNVGNDGDVDLDSGPKPDSPFAPVDAGPCVNTDTNPGHCGSCDHSCLGGLCSAGKCQPTPIVGATTGLPLALVGDTTHLYWNTETTGSIYRVAKAGGAVESIYSGGTNTGNAFALHGGFVYFPLSVSTGSIVRCPVTGCVGDPETVVAGVNGSDQVRIDGNQLTFTESAAGGRIGRCTLGAPLPCMSETLVANGDWPLRVTNAGDTTVWTRLLQGGGVMIKVGAAEAIRINASSNASRTVERVGAEIFFSGLDTGVRAMQLDGGGERQLADLKSTNTDYFVIAANGDVFFTETKDNGNVLRCSLQGCPGTGVGNVLAALQAGPAGITVDDFAVYWVNSGNTNDSTGSVMRLAR